MTHTGCARGGGARNRKQPTTHERRRRTAARCRSGRAKSSVRLAAYLRRGYIEEIRTRAFFVSVRIYRGYHLFRRVLGAKQSRVRPHSHARGTGANRFGRRRRETANSPVSFRCLLPASTFSYVVSRRGGSLCAAPKTGAVETMQQSDITTHPTVTQNRTQTPSHHPQTPPSPPPTIYLCGTGTYEHNSTVHEVCDEKYQRHSTDNVSRKGGRLRTASYVSLVRLGITRAPAGPIA